MSIKVMSLVWEHSAHKGSELLLLLAIADFADDDGVAWPGTARLGEKTRLARRTVYDARAKLQKSGELAIIEHGDGARTSRYQVNLGLLLSRASVRHTARVQISHRGGADTAPVGVQISHPNRHTPVTEPPEVTDDARTRTHEGKGSRMRDDWELDATGWGYATSKGLTVDEIRHYAEEFKLYWLSASGPSARKLDWGAAWRVRVLRIVELRGSGQRGSGSAVRSTAYAENKREREELLREAGVNNDGS